MVRFVPNLFWVAVPFLFVSAAVASPQLQGTSVSLHIWPHLNLDTNLNSNNLAVSFYFVLLLLQWYQLLTRPGVWIASPAPPATSSLHWSKSVFIVCPWGRVSAWGCHEPVPLWRAMYYWPTEQWWFCSVGVGIFNPLDFRTATEPGLNVFSTLFSICSWKKRLFCEKIEQLYRRKALNFK